MAKYKHLQLWKLGCSMGTGPADIAATGKDPGPSLLPTDLLHDPGKTTLLHLLLTQNSSVGFGVRLLIPYDTGCEDLTDTLPSPAH